MKNIVLNWFAVLSNCVRNHRSVSKVNDEWFADEEKVRKAVGLLEEPMPLPDGREVGKSNSMNSEHLCSLPMISQLAVLSLYLILLKNLNLQLTCGICFENYPRDNMAAAACGHPFCVTCWQGLFQ